MRVYARALWEYQGKLCDEDVYRLNSTVWRDNPAESIAEAQRRLSQKGAL